MKKNTQRWLSLFFVLAIVLSATLVGIAAAEMRAAGDPAPRAAGYYDKEYKYTSGTQFISDLAVSARDHSGTASGRENEAKGYITGAGYTLLGKDLNDGKNSSYIHMGYKMSTDESQAIRAIAFYNGSTAPSSYTYNINGYDCTFYPVLNSYNGSSTSSNAALDLNRQAGGDTIYMYYTRDPNAGPPMTAFDYDENSTNNSDSPCQAPAVWMNTNSKATAGKVADLNAGAGGDYIYLYYAQQNSTEVDTDALRTAVNSALSKNSANYTSDTYSKLTTAYNTGNAITSDYNTYGLSGSYDQTAINNATTAINNAINGLKTTVYLNPNGGALNGSTSNASTIIQIGGASSYSFSVAGYTPTRTGYTFKGWAASSAATSGSTSTVSVGFNQTIYAIWEANKYTVVFDNLVDFSAWNKTTAGNGTISNVTDNGFTLTSNDGVGEATSSSPFFPVTPGKQYRVDIDITGNAWDVYIFFCDANGTWVDFQDGPTNRYSAGGSTGVPVDNAVFTAPNKAEVVKAQIRVDANGSNNAVRFENIRVYEVGTVEDGASYETSKTVTFGSTYGTLPTPTRDGYEFLGWYKADGTKLNASDTVNVADNLYVTSQWKQLGYTITWKVDGQQDITSIVEVGKTPAYPNGTPTKAATAQYTYTFSGWSPALAPATADATYTAQFSQTTNKYKVTWIVDGVKTEQQWEYGQTPSFGSTPTKAADAQYTYTFANWDTTPSAVTKDVTYTAVFDKKVNTYTVTWLNDDNSVLEIDNNVEYGATPKYDGATPEKAATAEFSYEHSGWTPEIDAVKGNVTYKATYTATRNKYTVNWVVNNEIVETDTVEYGTVPTYDGDTPTKAATAQYTYTFKEWSPAVIAVTNDANYTATFTEIVNKYKVTWVDEDGTTELYSADFDYGAMPVYGAANPTKEATAQYTYTFDGWDKAYTAVTEAVTYTAKYTSTVNKYTIKFVNEDGTELQSSEVEYGTKPEYKGAEPTKAATVQYTYSFAGWDSEIAAVTGEATYTATYSSTVNKYTITFVDEDGTELQSDEVAYGETPAYTGETPTKDATAQYTYTFAGWDPEVVSVTGDATYTATYSSTVNKYTITWHNYNGDVIGTSEVEYGAMPEYVGATPERDADAQYTYTFKGWTPELAAVTGIASYTAVYDATVNTYTVTWVNDDDSVLETDTEVPYGATPSYDGATPTKAKDAQYTYTFDKWTPEISTVEGNITYKATYTTTTNTYTVTWKNENGNVLETDVNVPYGTTPSYDSAEPTKAATAEFTYTFNGWTPEIDEVEGDVTYTATYTATTNEYTITWIVDGVSETTTVAYGEMPTHAAPAKEATAQYTYTFAGWDPEVVAVTGDATYTAVFTETTNTYTVTWADEDGTVLETDTDVEYGATPTFDQANPTKAATAQYTYAFAGWTPTVSTVTGNVTYTATYSSTVNEYTIKFVDENGNVLQSGKVAYGTTPTAPADPTKAADAQYTYTFKGWSPEVLAVTGEATYTAVFDKTVNEYTITWIVDGEETTTTVAYGEMPEIADPTKAQTPEFTYEFAGWTPAVVSVTGDATYTATFTPITRSYKVTWVAEDGTTVLFTEDVLVGATIPTKEVPYKDGFIGVWGSYPATMPTNDLTIKAEYYEDGIKVNWVVDDTTTYQTAVRQGYKITPDSAWESKAPSVSTVYTFVGWSETKGGAIVDTFPTVTAGDTEDKTYYAVFTESVREYTITWIIDGVSETTTVAYGETPTHDDPSKAADKQYTYTFAGWTPAVSTVTGDATYTAQFDSTVNKYQVTWIVDGNTVKTEDVEYGTVPVFGADPTKEATAQYTYTFAGWDPAVSSVTDNATYTAKFNATVNKYTVTWVDENGTVLETDTNVEYGATPSFDSATPTKAATAQYTYTFAGWNKTIETVKGDVTYTATYSSTVNKYTVTWVNDDGTVLETDTDVEYGATPSYEGETPEKEATAQYTFAFKEWSPAVAEVTGNVTFTATYTSTVNKYTITFVNENGTQLQSSEVAYGETPAYTGETPVKTGDAQYSYVFTGWTPAIGSVTGVAEYTATFAQVVNTYTVTWVVEGTTVETDENVPYGTVPTFNGKTPTKAADAQYTYTFAGWDAELSAITGDTTYNATFDKTVNKYTVTWVNDDGSVIKTEEVEYGTMASYTGATPTKAATAQYTFTFDGWDKAFATVTEDVTYKATYTSTVNKYTVTWVVEGETVETDENVPYGTMVSYDGEEPTKTGDAQYSYTFAGWDAELSEVTGNVTYTATFTKTINKYTITWIVNGVETKEQVAYGTVPSFTGSTDKAPDNTTVYTFAGWDNEVVAVTGDATYTATYSEAVRKYTITWIVDGKTTTEQYEYNEVPSFKGSTDKPSTEGASYVFAGWDKEIANVTADITYTAKYDVTVRMFTITWIVGDQEIKQQWAYGTVPTFDGSTDKAPSATVTYAFAGWDKTPVAAKSDATYTAKYTESARKYTVVWYVDGEFFATQDVAYNTVIPSPGLPAEKEGYSVRWDNSVTIMPASDVEIHAIYTPKMYPVYWMVDGITVYSASVAYGNTIPTMAVPAKEGHTGKWKYIPETMPAGIVTIEAEYTARSYSVFWKIGDAQGTDTAVYGVNYEVAFDVATLPEELRVMVGGITIDENSYNYDPIAGKIVIYGSAITGNISIVAKATSGDVNVINTVSNGSYTNSNTVIEVRTTYHTTITPAAGYLLPKTVQIFVDGILLNSGYTYDATTGRLTINAEVVIGEIEIYAECPVDPDYDPSGSSKCTCNCHSSNAFVKFFFNIANFFRRLFGMTKYRYCACGAAHW